MGTHRSRHNHGRKPRYKERRPSTVWKRDPRSVGTASHKSPEDWNTYLGLLATMSPHAASKHPNMPSAAAFLFKRKRDPEFNRRADAVMASRSLHANSGKRPIAPDKWRAFLDRLPEMSMKRIAAIEGMPSEGVVYKRRSRDPDFRRQLDLILHAPGRELENRLAAGERLSNYRRSPDFNEKMYRARAAASAARSLLAYPYIARRRDEHADILAINDLVPRAFPDQMRADICQEAMLAVLEGKTTIAELRANRASSRWFMKKFWRDNFEDGGFAVPLDALADDRTGYEIASAIAAKDWHRDQMNDRRLARDSLRAFQPPTQIEEVHVAQVARRQQELADQALSFDEVEELLVGIR